MAAALAAISRALAAEKPEEKAALAAALAALAKEKAFLASQAAFWSSELAGRKLPECVALRYAARAEEEALLASLAATLAALAEKEAAVQALARMKVLWWMGPPRTLPECVAQKYAALAEKEAAVQAALAVVQATLAEKEAEYPSVLAMSGTEGEDEQPMRAIRIATTFRPLRPGERDDLVTSACAYIAADQFDDAIRIMHLIAKDERGLSQREREILKTACREKISSLSSAIDVSGVIHPEIVNQELKRICNEGIRMLDNFLLPSANDYESKSAYYTLKVMLYEFLSKAEVGDRSTEAKMQSCEARKMASYMEDLHENGSLDYSESSDWSHFSDLAEDVLRSPPNIEEHSVSSDYEVDYDDFS